LNEKSLKHTEITVLGNMCRDAVKNVWNYQTSKVPNLIMPEEANCQNNCRHFVRFIAKLIPSSSSSWIELALLLLIYQPTTHSPTRNSFKLSQPNSSSTQVGSDKVLSRTTPPPGKLLRHFQTTQEADFRYATLFWPK
jgi:hypothetical protein